MNRFLRNLIFSRVLDYRYEGLLLSLLMHFFLLIFLWQAYGDNKIFAKESHEDSQVSPLENGISKILVSLEHSQVEEVDSRVVSDKNLKGQGQLTNKGEQHILGDFSERGKYLSIEKKPQRSFSSEFERQLSVTDRQLEESDRPLDVYVGEWKTPQHMRNEQSQEVLEAAVFQQNEALAKERSDLNERIAIETENVATARFFFDEKQGMQVNVSSDEDAEYYLALAKDISARFALYFYSHRQLNYHFLKREQVKVLVGFDSLGCVDAIGLVKASQLQPYINYVALKSADLSSDVRCLRRNFSNITMRDRDLLLTFFYSGPPIRRWWLNFSEVEKK